MVKVQVALVGSALVLFVIVSQLLIGPPRRTGLRSSAAPSSAATPTAEPPYYDPGGQGFAPPLGYAVTNGVEAGSSQQKADTKRHTGSRDAPKSPPSARSNGESARLSPQKAERAAVPQPDQPSPRSDRSLGRRFFEWFIWSFFSPYEPSFTPPALPGPILLSS